MAGGVRQLGGAAVERVVSVRLITWAQLTMSKTEKLLETLNPADPASVQNAVVESLGLTVKVGNKVAVLNDPTYPFDGQRGVVKAINGGYAEVEFGNGTKVNLIASLLIPVG